VNAYRVLKNVLQMTTLVPETELEAARGVGRCDVSSCWVNSEREILV